MEQELELSAVIGFQGMAQRIAFFTNFLSFLQAR
jgi:hypothetical protein